MASISASVELYDRMSAPLMSIMNAMNMTISSMRDMQSTMGTDMDTSSLDAATQAANQAQAAMEALNQSMHTGGQTPGTGGSEPTPTPSTDPVQVPVEWVTNDLDVFSNSGIDRFEQEVTATNQMLTTLSDRQNQIAQNAAGTDIFSDSAMQDINSMGQRIQAVQQRIQQIENNPVNLGTDTANAELEELRSQLNQALQAQEALNQAVDNMDVSAANAAYNQLSSTVASTERYIRDNADAQGNLNQQIQAGVNTSNELVDTVKRLALTATAAQYGLNAALMACPLTWIILLIIAVIAAIFAVCNAIAKMTGVANSGFGVITGGINVVIQFFKNLGLTVANIALGIGNAIAALASNMMTAFHNAICSVQSWFYNLLSTALSVIEGICSALNKLPFVEFDYSGISSAADDYAAKASEAAGNKEDYQSISDAFNEGFTTFDAFQDGWAADAFNAGASWGDGVADKVSGMFSMNNIDLTGGVDTSMLSNDFANNAAQTAANTADTADSAGRIADSVDISKENLKYLRDIAETEAINRFTTAEIEVTMNNNNNISSDMDIDGMVDHLSAGLLEAMEQAAEGVH